MTTPGSSSILESIDLDEAIQDRDFTLDALRIAGVDDKQLLHAGVLFDRKTPRVDGDGYPVCSQPVSAILNALNDGTLYDVVRLNKYKLSQYYASGATNKNLRNVGVCFERDNVQVNDDECPVYSEPVDEISAHLEKGTLAVALKDKYLLSEYYASGVTDDDLIAADVTFENRKGVMHIQTYRKMPLVSKKKSSRAQRQTGEYDETRKRKEERNAAFLQSKAAKKANDSTKKRKETERRKTEEKETAYRDGPMQKGAAWTKSDRTYLDEKMKAAKHFKFCSYDGDPIDVFNTRETRPAELRACQRALDKHLNPTRKKQTADTRTYKVIVREICRLAVRMTGKRENIIPERFDAYLDLLEPIPVCMKEWGFETRYSVGGTGWVDAVRRFQLSERQVTTLDKTLQYVKMDVEHFDLELEVETLDLVKEDHLKKHGDRYDVSEKVKFGKEYSDLVGRIKEHLRAYDTLQESQRLGITQQQGLQQNNNAVRRFINDAHMFFKQEVRRLKQGKPRKRKATRPGTTRQQDILAKEQGRIGTIHTELPPKFKEPGRDAFAQPGRDAFAQPGRVASAPKRRKTGGESVSISLDKYKEASTAVEVRTFAAGPVGQGGIRFTAGMIGHTRQTAFPVSPVPSPVTTENGSCYSSSSDDEGLNLCGEELGDLPLGDFTVTPEELAMIGDVWKSS